MIEIYFKDIDPDTGEITQNKRIAVCDTEEMAKWVLYGLHLVEIEAVDPNRTIYAIPEVKLM